MKNFRKQNAIVLILIFATTVFGGFLMPTTTAEKKLPKSSAAANEKAKTAEKSPPEICKGTVQLNGTAGVFLNTPCNDNLKHISFTRVANPNNGKISDGQITYFFLGLNETLFVYSTDPNDFGYVTFAAFR